MGVRTEPSAADPGNSIGGTEQLPHQYTLSAPSIAITPRLCRDFVRNLLVASGLGQLADAAALCTSELVTNAYQHGKGDVRLAATIECTRVRVAVHDDSPALPSPRRAANDDIHGRGLFLVTALSDVCGLTVDEQLDGTGKAVWFGLSLPPGAKA
ncbi:hypothetical protein SBI_05964 [Streptomyces bingchenggensis BCW-1]|uniref:Histidine kinase/HSP90-like ATPase domain-containing protein n=1 Tax=Streptomyces bingchenggensis (strain BCW-1) TaxID=749414 RepID=D7CGI0_STRBB|nr:MULTISPECIES: ATP-binding protein [Streptomyces]ADI09084.1 hypothetical protein SBI_05964 [Streptomyces bingchenggensis BCW-1]